MTFALIACISLWTCAPEPLIENLTLKHCLMLTQQLKVDGVTFKCEKVK